MNRLTPEIVAAAFDQIGAVPARGVSGPSGISPPCVPTDCCCGMYAVLAAGGVRPLVRAIHRLDAMAILAAGLGVTRRYAEGFAWGWDCGLIKGEQTAPDDEWHRGFLDGRAAWQAVGEGREARRG